MEASESLFEGINNNINKCTLFSTEELNVFNGLLKPKKVKKKEYILREGEICTFESYIIKGCFRSFYIDIDGNEVILQFGIEDWWMGDISSFQNQIPSPFYIQALEDSEILTLSYHNKEKLLLENPKFERVFRLMIQKRLQVLEKRLIRTMAHTAEERYLEFIENYPLITQRVPQHYIASYLGMTPEFLSKIRRRLIEK